MKVQKFKDLTNNTTLFSERKGCERRQVGLRTPISKTKKQFIQIAVRRHHLHRKKIMNQNEDS